ncbi:MAG: hypothetical protein ACYC63_01365 [Armatimonadota bacterium]
MAQFEYQVVEQAGGRASHLNERITQLVGEGWEPIMMTGSSPQVSVMMRRPAQDAAQPRPQPAATAAAPRAPAPAAPAPGAPAAPRPPMPAQPGQAPPRPPQPQ